MLPESSGRCGEVQGMTTRQGAGRDIRCKRCGILLGRIDDSGLAICRSDLQVSVDWGARVSLVCYRPGCHTLTVLNLPAKTDRGHEGAAACPHARHDRNQSA